MQVPVATINLLDDERHRSDADAYKLTEIITQSGKPLVVPGGTEGEVLADNPYLQSNGVTFYAGVPLVLDTGLTVGSLVIIDYEEHELGDADLLKLQDLAADLVLRFGNVPSVAQAETAA